MKYTAIILAAGKGSRMDSDVYKQYMELGGYPLICYPLFVFEQSRVDEIVLVTGEDETEYCQTQIVDKYQFHKVRKIVRGGSERYLSVYQGLCAIEDTDIVLIHDGARPFVTVDIIDRTICAAEQYGTGVAAVPAKDTVKIADEQHFVVCTPDRGTVWMMQTPQTFRYPLICQAYERVIRQHIRDITDDAMVVECGLSQPGKLVEGSYRNIKVTTPEDMEIASVFAESTKIDKKIKKFEKEY